MRFIRDARAVSEVIGSILIFAVVVLLISLVQVNAVPQSNEQVEFDHSQRVQSDIGELDSAVIRTISTGGAQSIRIELGTRYPERFFLLNPPPATGQLKTINEVGGERAETSLSNITTRNKETADYVSGTLGPFSTRLIEYNPSYNEYNSAPSTTYENTVVVNRDNNRSMPLDKGNVVDGRRLLLPMIEGNFSESGVDPTAITLVPANTPTTPVSITNESGKSIVLTLTTQLSEDTWREEILSDELDTGADDDKHIVDITCLSHDSPAKPCNGDLAITLERNVTYELRMAKIGIGSESNDENASYLTTIAGDGGTVSVDGSRKLVVEVRDRYNNPVSGVQVNIDGGVSGSASGTVKSSAATTGIDGRAMFVFEPDSSGTATISMNIAENPVPREEVTFEMDVLSPENSAYSVRWDTATIETEEGITGCDETTCTYDRGLDTTDNEVALTGYTSPTAISSLVDFAVGDDAIASLGATEVHTDSSGEASVDLDTRSTGTLTVFMTSGGSSDTLRLEVVDSGGSGSAPSIDTFDIRDMSNPGQGAQFDVDWSVSDGDGDLDRVELRLIDDSGTVVDSASVSVGGSNAAGSTRLRDGGGYGDTFTVEIAVTDEQDNTSTDSKRVTA